ncbi:MAG TPA: tetratricopeptide repeat protein [Chryseosolibacter sp.]|nr:tetratricopeptide repeat protein [Chryseosolibacter sp.]
MKVVLFIALFLVTLVDPATVRRINAAKSAAEDAFKSGDYSGAVRHYKYLVDSLGITEDEVVLNLANAYFLTKDTASAFNAYQRVTSSPQTDIRSKAHQQLGIMANQQGKFEEALNFFKQAIKAEPSNDDARYNYEMVKKKLEDKKKEDEEKQQQNKDNQKQDQQNKDQQNKEQEEKEKQEQDQESKDEQNKDQQQKEKEQREKEQKEQQEKEQEEKDTKEQQQQQENQEKQMPNLDREKLQEMKISEEKARMILEAMKNQEKQYLQQQKRKPTQTRDRNKPDW